MLVHPDAEPNRPLSCLVLEQVQRESLLVNDLFGQVVKVQASLTAATRGPTTLPT